VDLSEAGVLSPAEQYSYIYIRKEQGLKLECPEKEMQSTYQAGKRYNLTKI